MNPVDPSPLVGAATAAATAGVRTFVIGSPGSDSNEAGNDTRAALSAMAEAGGTAFPGCSHDGPNFCHFDMTQEADFATALTEALAQISGQVLSCTYTIPAPPDGKDLDLEKVNVKLFSSAAVEPELIGQSPEGVACTNGWQYSAGGTELELCGATCEQVKSLSGARVEIEFGCTTTVQ
jgi:hypothetical protein